MFLPLYLQSLFRMSLHSCRLFFKMAMLPCRIKGSIPIRVSYRSLTGLRGKGLAFWLITLLSLFLVLRFPISAFRDSSVLGDVSIACMFTDSDI